MRGNVESGHRGLVGFKAKRLHIGKNRDAAFRARFEGEENVERGVAGVEEFDGKGVVGAGREEPRGRRDNRGFFDHGRGIVRALPQEKNGIRRELEKDAAGRGELERRDVSKHVGQHEFAAAIGKLEGARGGGFIGPKHEGAALGFRVGEEVRLAFDRREVNGFAEVKMAQIFDRGAVGEDDGSGFFEVRVEGTVIRVVAVNEEPEPH